MSEDTIKRSDVAEVVYKALKTPPPKGVLTDTMSLAIALVRDIPSADRPQGEWTDIYQLSTDGRMTAQCKNCREKIIFRDKTPNFCPNCGAYMKGADDE